MRESHASPSQRRRQLDQFVEYYSEARPHRGINRRTPIGAFEARTKAPTSASGRC
jgi:transposase InsO family protein